MAEQDDLEAENGGQNDNLKDLRRAADEGRAAKAEAAKLQRELAFAKAGVDTDSKLGQMLFKTYEGDLDVEAIKAEAAEIGIGQPAPTPPAEDPAERAQTRERSNLASEVGTPHSHEANPYTLAESAFKEAKRNGDPTDIAFGAALAHIFEAAQRGDSRVIA